jgi:PhnB protein
LILPRHSPSKASLLDLTGRKFALGSLGRKDCLFVENLPVRSSYSGSTFRYGAKTPPGSARIDPSREEIPMYVQAYLAFDGRCEEAIEFYRDKLGAEVVTLMRFKDAPSEPAGEGCPGGFTPPDPEKIMHSAFKIGETTIMATDGMRNGQPNFQGISLALTARDEAHVENVFEALATGGQVQVPLTKTFFASKFGIVVDKFGVNWMIVSPERPAEAHKPHAATATA